MTYYPASTGYNPYYREALLAEEQAQARANNQTLAEAQANFGPQYTADRLAQENARRQLAQQQLDDLYNNKRLSPGYDMAEALYKEEKAVNKELLNAALEYQLNKDRINANPIFPNADDEYQRLSALADLVIKGKMGSGASRKKQLGADYAKVQKIVNSRLKGEKDPVYELMAANAMGGA